MWLLETFIEESPDMSQGCQLIREVIRQLAMSLVSSGMTDNDTISYEVISSFLQDNLTEYTSKGGFLQGGVTFCRLVPMRSIPAKVICLLGMNEGNFPRQTQKLSFDIMAKYPRPGDREAKKEDRGVFLETLLAVRKLLYISYVGRDIHTRQSLPPSSVVNELMDYLNRHFFLDHTASQNAPLCDHLLTEHPLQPFSRKYFECDPISGEKLHPHLVSYNPQALLLAQERQRQEGERPPQAHFFHPLAQDVLNEIPETFKQPNLEEISTFFRSPCQYFLNKRLNVSFDPIQERNQLQDNEPFALDGLEEFQIKQDLLEHCYLQTRCSTTDLKAKTRAAGILPVGVWGERTYQDISAMIAPLGEHIQNRIQRQHDPFKLTLSFPRLNMTLETELRNMYQIKGTEETAQTLVRPAKEKNKDILWAWLLHLIANSQAARQKASLPPIQTKAFYMDKEITYVPLGEREEDNGPDQAEIFLEQLLTIYLDGLTRPLPFSPKASLTYCTQLSTHPDKAWPMAENAWKPDKYNYEPADSHTIYIFGETLPESEQDRALFCQLAKTVFQPVLRYRQEKNSPLYSR
jgi:exodeoxyribonuclease V gamma subunit